MYTNDKENDGRISIIWLIILIGICLILGFNNYSKNEEIKKLNSTISSKNSTIEDLNDNISNLNSTINSNMLKLSFMDNYVCIIGSSNNYYHKYGCEDLDTSSFKIFNPSIAQELGFNPCPKCKNDTTISTNENQITTSYTVYVTDTGSKYHRAGCSYLRSSSHPIDINKAIQSGYSPCSRCNP